MAGRGARNPGSRLCLPATHWQTENGIVFGTNLKRLVYFNPDHNPDLSSFTIVTVFLLGFHCFLEFVLGPFFPRPHFPHILNETERKIVHPNYVH